MFLFVVTISCQTYYTPLNLDGGGNIVYLDSHRVNYRRNKMMQSLQLMRYLTLRKYHYRYTCCTTPNACYQKTFHNNFTYDGRGNAIYLNRQNVQCQNDDYITYFRLNRNSAGNKVRYTYKCCHFYGKSKTNYNTATPWNSDEEDNARYLDRHNMSCIHGYGLTKCRLVQLPPSHYRYEFKCTKVNMWLMSTETGYTKISSQRNS